MMTRTQTLNLEKGKEYDVRMFPGEVIVKARYQSCEELSGGAMYEVFSINNKEIILVGKHWIRQENGIITHNCFSSAPVQKVNLEELEESMRLSPAMKDSLRRIFVNIEQF